MAETRHFRVVGGLGEGGFAPLLAEAVFVDGYRRMVVLHRPAPEAAWPLSGAGSWRVVPDEGRLVTPQGTFAVSPYVAGRDADALAEAGLSGRALGELLVGTLEALLAARAVGVGHGAVRGAAIRVGPAGEVRMLGFRGDDRDDLAELRDLAEGWVDDLPAPLAAWLAAPADGLEDALRSLRPVVAALPGPSLAEQVADLDPSPVLRPHALIGAELQEAAPPPPMPAKVRVAGTAALTLVLGLAAGAVLFGGVAGAPSVGPSGGEREHRTVRCGGGTVEIVGEDLSVRTEGCEEP